MFLVDLQARVTAMKHLFLSQRPLPEIIDQVCQQLSGLEITPLSKKLYKQVLHFAAEFNRLRERYDLHTAEDYHLLSVAEQHQMLVMLQDICQGLQRFIYLSVRKNLRNP